MIFLTALALFATLLLSPRAVGQQEAKAPPTDARSEEATPPAERAVYGIGLIRIDDRDAYREYERDFGRIFQRYGGTIAAASEQPAVIEGEWPWTRTVLIRFPSRAEFDRWYQSPEYQALAKLRWSSSVANLVLVEARP
jgi:uncharacterized protein (DUF1330 family)